jgi:hypothetical protein
MITLPNWNAFVPQNYGAPLPPELATTYLGPDSLTDLPSERLPRRTFFEIYKNNLYIRTEGDTVDMNSWLVFHAGGTDLDSPYSVAVNYANYPQLAQDTLQGLPPGHAPARVVVPGPPNGSPVGFQYINSVEQTPFGSPVPQPLSKLFPVFDAARFDLNPVIGAYLPVQSAGTTYFAMEAVDGNSARDSRLPGDPRLVGDASPLRSLVLKFEVDKPPRFEFDRPGFVPRPDTAFFTRSNLAFNLFATDDDPYDLDPNNRPAGPGGPSKTVVLRWTVTLRGKNADGQDTTYAPPGGFRVSTPAIPVDVPSYIVGDDPARTDVYADIELCDCSECEQSSGSGRCIHQTIHFTVPKPTLQPWRQASASILQGPRPGPNPNRDRSR